MTDDSTSIQAVLLYCVQNIFDVASSSDSDVNNYIIIRKSLYCVSNT
jgi:hypothetical protein